MLALNKKFCLILYIYTLFLKSATQNALLWKSKVNFKIFKFVDILKVGHAEYRTFIIHSYPFHLLMN